MFFWIRESQVKLIPIHMGPYLLGLVQRERNPKMLRANFN